MIVKIYCLYDPITCEIRYIGRTSKKILDHRLIEHISKAKYYNRYYPGKKAPHRVNWINSLLKKGVEPKIKLLCLVEGWKESHKKERELIKKYKNTKRLVNSDDLGIGGYNRVIKKETKQKISKSLKDFNKKGDNMDRYYTTVHVYNREGVYLQTYKSNREASKKLKISLNHIEHMMYDSTRTPIHGYYFKKFKVDKLQISKKPPNLKMINKETKEEICFSNIDDLLLYFNIGKLNGYKALYTNRIFKNLLKTFDFYRKGKIYLPCTKEI